ncbi:MAG: N-acetyltransferase [Alphaproteobacteria bacterium]|nr:MAG: N-acetyltransferase [Alphaproteobacteria bacterium]
MRHDGAFAALVPIDPVSHGGDLWAAAQDPAIWTYMPFGPFASRLAFDKLLDYAASNDDLIYYAIVDQSDQRALGMMAHMRIKHAWATIEIGGIWFGPELKRSRIATEAIYLSIAYPMDELGYLRMEWKCDDLNDASKAAAKRFGFTDEGVHRQHMIVKGKRRNTRWLSILDTEWPDIKARFERWLDPSNFDEDGRQRVSLKDV